MKRCTTDEAAAAAEREETLIAAVHSVAAALDLGPLRWSRVRADA